MLIGWYGQKAFQVDENTIVTPSGLKFTSGVTIEAQDRLQQKPASYAKGINLQTISFDIILAWPYCRPDDEISYWRSASESFNGWGLILGNRTIGGWWQITDISVDTTAVAANGAATAATISINLQEFVIAGSEPPPAKEKKSKDDENYDYGDLDYGDMADYSNTTSDGGLDF